MTSANGSTLRRSGQKIRTVWPSSTSRQAVARQSSRWLSGKEPRAATLRRDPVRRRGAGKETLDPGPLVADAKVEPRGWRRPDHLAEPQPGRPPIILDQPARMIAAQPRREVVELVAIGQDCRQADDAAFMRRPARRRSRWICTS